MDKQGTNFEKNIAQVYASDPKSSPLMMKDFKRRNETSSVRSVVIFGCRFSRKELWVLTLLSSLFATTFTIAVIMWLTSSFDNFIISQFILINNSAAFLHWKEPPLKTLVKIHIFNYTNVEAYKNGVDSKLHVEDVGPFVYEETAIKTNIKFYPNSTLSYQEFYSHVFRQDLSHNVKESTRVTVPNLSVLGAAAATKNYFYVTRLAVSAVMRGLFAEPFLNLAAHRFIWGYDDNLFELAKTVLSFKKKFPFEKFGILATRNGTSNDVVTVNSGLHDLSKIGQIERVNGENNISHWNTPECNRIKGSDGAFYPVYKVREQQPVSVYLKDICRRIPLVYKGEVKVMKDQIKAYRYGLSDTIFDRPDIEPSNQCFCEANSCPPRGIFNISKCAFDAPASISFPHFYKADPALQNGVTGLKADPEKHTSYLDLHPTLGFPIGGKFRLQVNVQIQKSSGISQLDMFEDGIYLPVAWIDVGVDPNDLPEGAAKTIVTVSVTLPAVENAIKYGCLVIMAATFLSVAFIVKRKVQERLQNVLNFQRISIVYS